MVPTQVHCEQRSFQGQRTLVLQQANHTIRTDYKRRYIRPKTDLKHTSAQFGLSFLCSPSWLPYFKFIHHLCATSLPKTKQGEKVSFCLSFIISTYCLLIFTSFTELPMGVINNKRWVNLLADTKYTANVLSRRSFRYMHGTEAGCTQGVKWPTCSQKVHVSEV